ncbi:hypothetical protein QFZ80_001467 [Paenibacillus sp. V4I7]|jgi:hypothetical protein|nr:hypothetical protein [Paenibacillus sp. V4I7]MDQ0916355.1 hypothetical protein [Paenibacillus sp. V4I5]
MTIEIREVEDLTPTMYKADGLDTPWDGISTI